MERCRGNYFKIQLSTGITLFFMDQELPRQFKRFIQLYPKILQQHGDEPAYIDFRYQHGNFAIK